MFHIITEELGHPDGVSKPDPIERLSLRVDSLDLPAVVRMLTTPPRKPRSDKGQRKEKP